MAASKGGDHTMTEHADRSTPTATVALSIRELRHVYPSRGRRSGGPIKALDAVSLDIATGSMVALLGPNGSGKSTLIRICAGLLQQDSGEIKLFGEPLSAAARLRLGIVFQSPGLDPHMTIRENLRMAATLTGVPQRDAEARMESLMQSLSIADRADSRVKSLSGGLARRADLCRALLHDPDVLLLDEPTVGLDPRARRQFLDLVQEQYRQRSLTVLMSTHLTDEADRADRVIMMDRGAIAADDTPIALRSEVGKSRLVVHSSDWTPNDGDRDQWQEQSAGWVRDVPSDNAARIDLFAVLTEQDCSFSLQPPTLDDVFMLRTGHALASDAGEARA